MLLVICQFYDLIEKNIKSESMENNFIFFCIKYDNNNMNQIRWN
uniref:Uncharacterized protein n=1 Tax=Siphoviridae sp. ctzpQ31 TaxID=2823613 RepID=A0A8S5L8C2_9CAUD|nr:MAG TPA: hypothetical protein [Siphoviridae sp. ctzpQ31]DAY03698.1 MAG TPA: hypothetical protein [Bacteriophage sp.]